RGRRRQRQRQQDAAAARLRRLLLRGAPGDRHLAPGRLPDHRGRRGVRAAGLHRRRRQLRLLRLRQAHRAGRPRGRRAARRDPHPQRAEAAVLRRHAGTGGRLPRPAAGGRGHAGPRGADRADRAARPDAAVRRGRGAARRAAGDGAGDARRAPRAGPLTRASAIPGARAAGLATAFRAVYADITAPRIASVTSRLGTVGAVCGTGHGKATARRSGGTRDRPQAALVVVAPASLGVAPAPTTRTTPSRAPNATASAAACRLTAEFASGQDRHTPYPSPFRPRRAARNRLAGTRRTETAHVPEAFPCVPRSIPGPTTRAPPRRARAGPARNPARSTTCSPSASPTSPGAARGCCGGPATTSWRACSATPPTRSAGAASPR